MDTRGLTLGEMVAGSAGIVLMVASVIPQWGSISIETAGIDESKTSVGLWESGVFGVLPKLAALSGLATVVLVLVRATGAVRSIPTGSYLALGVTATLLMLMGVAVGPTVQGGGLGWGLEEERGPLLYAGAILCAAILFGGWLHLRGEDTGDYGNRSAAPPPM